MSHLFKGGGSQLFMKVTLLCLFLYSSVSQNMKITDYDLVFTAHYADKFLNIVQFVELWDL